MRLVPYKPYHPFPWRRNRWLKMVACEKCLAIITCITTFGGQKYISYSRPCPACGSWQEAKLDDDMPHGVSVIARYECAFQWWKPWTWLARGRWRLSDESLEDLAPEAKPMLELVDKANGNNTGDAS